MSKNRLELQAYLENILGSRNVYFQPPENVKIKYPAIIYSRVGIDGAFADNSVYKLDHAYQIIYVHTNPDDQMIDTLAMVPTCRFQREYVTDNIYHDAFIIYWK